MGDGNYNLNSVDVVKWQQGSKENNCYWNIAQNQLEQQNGSASAAEIKALAEQIQKETEARNTAIANRDGILYEGDQIFIPLEYAMDEIQANIGTITEQVTQASGAYKEASSRLTTANSSLASALSAYQSAQAAYDPEAEDADDSQVNAAKQAYLDALKEQQEAAKEAQTAQEELEKAQGDLDSAKTEYQELVEEYDGEKENIQSQLDEVDAQIKTSEDELNNLQQEYDAAETKAQLEEAERSKAAAENIGVTQGDDGAFALEENPDADTLKGAMGEVDHTGPAQNVEDLGIKENVNKITGTMAVNPDDLEFRENGDGTYTAEFVESFGDHPGADSAEAKRVVTYDPETGEVSLKSYSGLGEDDEVENDEDWTMHLSYDPESDTKTSTFRGTRSSSEGSGPLEETYVEHNGKTHKTEETFNGVTTKWEYDEDGNLISEKKYDADGVEIEDNEVPLADGAEEAIPQSSDELIDGLANFEAENGWLEGSDYYQNLATQIRTSLSDTNKTLTLAEKQDLYRQIQEFDSHIGEFSALVDPNSENYNEIVAQNFAGNDLIYIYQDKINETGDEQEAYNTINKFLTDSTALIDVKNQTDALYEQVENLYQSDDLTPTQKLLLNDFMDEYDFNSSYGSSYSSYNSGASGVDSMVITYCYSGNCEIPEQEYNATLETYKGFQENIQPIFDAIDIESKTSDWKEDDPKYELMNLYNEFVSNHEGSFKGDDKKAKEYAEGVLRMYLSGLVSENSVETAIQNLKNRINT